MGLNHQKNVSLPAELRTIRSVRVKYITGGEDFSVFLTYVYEYSFLKLFLHCILCVLIYVCYFVKDGGVFTCGAGMYGQLGHGSFSNEIIPRKVIELMGSTVTQVTCGRYLN